ncbi:MAG: energy transducer TonB [Acidobacteriota bacterium]
MFDRPQGISRVLILAGLALLMPRPVLASGYVVIGEESLRKLAIISPTPGYPTTSKQNRATGVSVTKFYVDEKGHVENIQVLQAPDQFIEASLVKAISQWKFQPYHFNGRTRRVLGKLTFYFTLERGRGDVQNPRFTIFSKDRQR